MIIRILLLLTLMFGSVNTRADVTDDLSPFTPGSVGYVLSLTGNHPYFNYVDKEDSTSACKKSENSKFDGLRAPKNIFTGLICLVLIFLMLFFILKYRW